VKITLINIVGKLPQGLVDLYVDISRHAKALGINYLVVGAMARDLVLVHGFGSEIERGTRDVDFGINVASWGEFNALKSRLVGAGYKANLRKTHQLNYMDKSGLSWEIDIVPFGGIADDESNIYWPPEEALVMNVLGFPEAFTTALNVKISQEPEVVIPVASPVGICLLKLVAWLDRHVELRSKDATDFLYLIQTYHKIPEIFEALYDQGHMEHQGWDETKASAMKLGKDVSVISSLDTRAFLEASLFSDDGKAEEFVRDMERNSHKDIIQSEELFNIFKDAFLKEY